MTLPSPDEIERKEYWNDYWIGTPTFRLTPVEKPDMSPFLIHMTGKDAILSILKGEEDICEVGEGCLLASVPEYPGGNLAFDAKVICFTESPTFAIDFFRYRRVERWDNDQRFGIGFSKEKLVVRGVRPVIYLEDSLISKIIKLFYVNDEKIVALEEKEEESELSQRDRRRLTELLELDSILERLHPLLFPLIGSKKYQGFMWEREWRYFDSDDFIFSYRDIKVICCPEEEETGIREILGSSAAKIDFCLCLG